jgi:hypothetical protein
MAHLLTQEGNPVTFNEVSVGDSVFFDQTYFRLLSTNISDLCDFTELLTPQKYYLTTYYRHYRKFPLGADNFNICFAYKIIEYSYLWKDPRVLRKLSQSMMSVPKSIVDYFLSSINTHSFSQAFSTITQMIQHLNILGKEILEIYGNFQICLENLGISLKLLTSPNMTQEYLNNSGTIEFVFFCHQGNYYSLYTNDEVALIRSQADLKKFQNFYKTEHNMPEMVNDKKQTESDLKRQNLTMIKMISDQVKINIELLKIDNGLFHAINFLKQRGENANELEEALKAKYCCICRKPNKETIALDCKHYYCKPCLQFYIKNETEGKIVLNDEEKKKAKPCICCVPGCGVPVSENALKKTFENYDQLKENANNRLVFSCVNCRTSKPIGQMIVSCRHLCNDCAIQFMKFNQFDCSACKSSFSVSDKSRLADLEKECFGCQKTFNVLKGIINADCGHSYCMACLAMSNSRCLMTGANLKIHPNLILPTTKKCDSCKENYQLLESNDLKRVCKCNYCDKCLGLNMEKHSTSCFQCNFIFSDKLIDYMKTCFKFCKICFTGKNKDDFLIFEVCDDIVCHECFKSHKEAHFKDKNIEEVTKCPICKLAISSHQYDSLFDKIQLDEILAYRMEEAGDLINCHKCKFQFQVINKIRKQRCPSCGDLTCEVCKEKFHEVEFDCWSKFIDERLRELESVDEEGGVTQCPGCRTPYIKNQNCDHVECIMRKCRVSFCFSCACIRAPYMTHGNHYHRPECRFYSDFNEETYDYKCKRCRDLGKACPRPKRLKIPRRVGPDEVEKIIKAS